MAWILVLVLLGLWLTGLGVADRNGAVHALLAAALAVALVQRFREVV